MSSSLAEPFGVMQRLRATTREEHAAIESALPLLSPSLTLDEYRRCLMRFRGYYGPLEQRLQRLADVSRVPVDLLGRLKVPHLDADLRDLGCADPAAVPECSTVPVLESVSDALGCLYVVEGASLGGQIISRHLEHTLGILPTWAGRFFFGYGARTGAMWREFAEAATAFATTAPRERRMIAAAIETFRTLRAWLTVTASEEPRWARP